MNKNKWMIIGVLIVLLTAHFLRVHHAKSMVRAATTSGTTTSAGSEALAWPLDCYKGENCLAGIGYPDITKGGRDFDCNPVAIRGHEGTDIAITEDAMERGVKVYAAADGVVQWVYDGSYDHCPSSHPDCQAPAQSMAPGVHDGYMVCTPLGPTCKNGQGQCFWCFFGGNVVVIRHDAATGVFATRYDHLRRGSIQVKPGERVSKGQVIGLAGSAGKSTGPHLHFEIWKSTFYDPYDPWDGQCHTADRQLWPYQAGGPAR